MKSDNSFEGWTNSATYLAALYLSNEVKIYNAISAIKKERGVTAKDCKLYFQRYRLSIDNWAEGAINWEEIAEDYNTNLDK